MTDLHISVSEYIKLMASFKTTFQTMLRQDHSVRLTGFVFQKRKKERKKTCLPDSLASVILLLEPTYQVFFLNYPFFLVRWGLGLSDSNPLKGQTPAVPLPPLWDGSKGHSPAYHLPFCNISHQNHLLSNNFAVTLNAYFGIICLSNVCFIANQKASQLLVSFML